MPIYCPTVGASPSEVIMVLRARLDAIRSACSPAGRAALMRPDGGGGPGWVVPIDVILAILDAPDPGGSYPLPDQAEPGSDDDLDPQQVLRCLHRALDTADKGGATLDELFTAMSS